MDFQKQYARLEKEAGIDLSIIGMRKKESERRRVIGDIETGAAALE